MNISQFTDMEVDDAHGFEDFSLSHAMSHEQYYAYFLTLGIVINHYPYVDAKQWDRDWLAFHQIEHQGIYDALGATGMPDLASSNLKDEGEFATWMDLHRQVHEYINQALNL